MSRLQGKGELLRDSGVTDFVFMLYVCAVKSMDSSINCYQIVMKCAAISQTNTAWECISMWLVSFLFECLKCEGEEGKTSLDYVIFKCALANCSQFHNKITLKICADD